ncbi:MAG: ABC transporter substrate-binding protein, partial [Proteobacteria bacterium]|nr:ABC transporter substrate-binding protein [Pseudomonadota bacterium]MBU1709233.1 ABC transporter substrate-binding protein [Pseudomonadota bacterium]
LEEKDFRKSYLLVKNGTPIARLSLDSSTGGKQLIRKLTEDQFDMAFGGVPSMISYIDQGKYIKILAPVMTEGSGLVLGKNNPVNSWEEFKNYVRNSNTPIRIGYKIDVSVQNLIFESALKESGIIFTKNLDDKNAQITLINLNGAKNLIPALENEIIDGFVVNQPFPALAEYQEKGKLIADLSDLPPAGKWKNNPCCALAARTEFSSLYPEITTSFVSLMLRANNFINENPELVAQQISKWLDLPVEVEKKSLPTINFITEFDADWDRGVEFWIKEMIDSNKIRGKVKSSYESGRLAEELYLMDTYHQARKNL